MMISKENFWRKKIIFKGGGGLKIEWVRWGFQFWNGSVLQKNKADLDDNLNVADEIDAEGVDDVDDEDEADEN